MYLKVSFPFYCIFLHLKIANCFIVPDKISDVEERFVQNDIEYLILKARVTWTEAQIICESLKNGSLAIVDTNKTSKFLAVALSESNMELEGLWVGGQREFDQDNFTWIGSKGILPTTYLSRRKPLIVNISRNCLSFQRKNHSQPNFVDLKCELKRAVICQRPYEKVANGEMTTSEWIRFGKYVYAIFYDEKTWRQAVSECRRKHKAHLASFRNIEEVQLMGKFELIGRPSLENAWIGGYFNDGVWKFISSGDIIPETTNQSTSFPPWRKNKLRKTSGCLLLDRHLDIDGTIFLEARCERKRSYICSKELKNLEGSKVFILNETGYIVYYNGKSWDDALRTCNDIDAKLLRVTYENLHDITYMMGESFIEIRHIWLSGRLSKDGTHFIWVYEDEEVQPNYLGIAFYPPWYDMQFEKNYPCLNMDRENHNYPMLYGIVCETPQAFICEQNNISKLPNVTTNNYKVN